ncbi:BA75_01964T0 [Komagataella pastoris]|uniref:BA75_01964T0 n=1 Tax=Komagataella pastoris TaxID=4922 RepID=A0A1B2JBI6_PICPA|nr:BA75_01964T0 [Komagataella pastoris]
MTENTPPNRDPFDSGSDVFSDAVNFVSNMPLSEYFSADEISERGLETNISDAKVRDLELWDSDDVLGSDSRLRELIFDIESQQMSCESCPQLSGNSGNGVHDATVTAHGTERALESLGMSKFRNIEVLNTAKAPIKSSDEVSEFQYSEKVISLLSPKMSTSLNVEKDSQKGHQLEGPRQSEKDQPNRNSLVENCSINGLDTKEEHDPPYNSMNSIHRHKSIVKVISSMQGMFKKREPLPISRDLSPTQIISLTIPRKFLQTDSKSKKNSLRKWRSYMGLNQNKRETRLSDASEVKKQLIKTISEGSLSMTNCADDNLVGFCIVPVNQLH